MVLQFSLYLLRITFCLTVFLLPAALWGAQAEESRTVVLKGGRIFDGNGGPPLQDGVVVVRDGIIQAVGSGGQVQAPPGATIIDVTGASILPGLADLHVHPAHFMANPRVFEDDSLSALRAAAILRQGLDAGITLMRDAAGRNNVTIGLKKAVEAGYLVGPRYVVSNRIVGATGAHGSEFELMLDPKWAIESDSPGAWRRAIRLNLKLGADFIKVTPPFTREEIELAVAETHLHGARIAVHAGGFGDTNKMMVEWAVNAGADTIEHLYPMKNESAVIEKMVRQGTIVVPTISASRRFAGASWDNPGAREIAEETRPQDYRDRFIRFHRAGVKMAIGTDVGGKDQGKIGEFYRLELELFQDWGYSAAEILQAATRLGAEAAGLLDQTGTIEAGKSADLMVVDGNPLEDITRITRPRLVMLEGRIVRGE